LFGCSELFGDISGALRVSPFRLPGFPLVAGFISPFSFFLYAFKRYSDVLSRNSIFRRQLTRDIRCNGFGKADVTVNDVTCRPKVPPLTTRLSMFFFFFFFFARPATADAANTTMYSRQSKRRLSLINYTTIISSGLSADGLSNPARTPVRPIMELSTG